ncbi:GntR family transcriptional regulator [Kineococcus sp. SYSU DK001]|uniref:GntR family transcriptional regulator n=1 Tax=Kineococcus sp. SYSU DK001 TaxID=3383122 RepID=UPI003D7DB439
MQRLTIRPSVEARERLEALVVRGNLRPGDRLPTERELAARWGISRAAVRSAIRRLADEGVVYNVQGSGTYVAAPPVVRDLRDLRPFAEAAAAAGRTLRTEVLGWDVEPADAGTGDRLDLPVGDPVHVLRRLRLIDDVPAALERSVLAASRFPDLPRQYGTHGSLYAALRGSCGVEVVAGYEQLSVSALDEAAAGALAVPPGTSVLSLSGVAHEASGAPVEHFSSLVRTDQVRFASELRAVAP